ncbi:MAG: RagB/SusD family nutrient uptake outer membrane protein [Candidatus Pedobacter colombiensis]|uniref:RagB/SusD family nutrient uptake outer membrane protein n=1 Tax=Candidatus Pedobacter colombiensis TaxID=3121371 RepID=A0AAJ6B6C3_9SPHI|nr:RagB/SusD family nutrient uptake outer membrane protein [Pedobacter sp.]WEK19020.1 MAG: RagB/SusD family nutrient uptake outer membrane protein [Pedobacter sp.]
MKHTIKYLTLIAILTSASSCKKYLEQAPDLRATINTPAKVSELLVTAYPRGSYITFCEAASDNAEDKGIAATDEDLPAKPVNRDAWYFRDIKSNDTDSPDNYWNECYAAIAVANQALASIKANGNPQAYTAQTGEALVARAYAHFMLVTLFSHVYDVSTAETDPGVPYVTEPEVVVFKKYSRKTVAYVYQQIEKDLTEGLPLINDNSYKIPKYHFTTSAAHAFAARFYLFKKDYAKVVEHANLVFPGGNIAANLRNFVIPAFTTLEYGARQALYTAADNPANILLQETETGWARSYPSYRYALTNNLLYKTMFGPNVTGANWDYKVSGREFTLNTSKFSEHFVKTNPNSDVGDSYAMIPIFSAEEVLFNRAEANAYLGNSDAALKDLTDFVNKRIIAGSTVTAAKITSYYKPVSLSAGIVQTVLDFKKTEYLFEGLRWFDILRYNLPVVHKTADLLTTLTLGPNDPRRVFQIPEQATLAGIERNPR